MQRTKKVPEKVRFIKLGGGILRLANGRIIKPKQVFDAYPEEIPEAFRDTIKPVDKEKQEVYEETGIVESKEPEFELKNEGGGWYNVVNRTTEKPINEKKLRKEDAEDLLKAVEAK